MLPSGEEEEHPHYKRETASERQSEELDLELLRTSDGVIGTFQIRRRSTRRVIFDTKPGALIYSDQYLQIAAALPSANIYGFGENVHKTLKVEICAVYSSSTNYYTVVKMIF